MSFRQAKHDDREASLRWQTWIDQHRIELLAAGLPAELFSEAARWSDFLENGHLHWHESSGFEFSQLNPGRMAALHRFLEREYGESERPPPLLRWLRVRCG